MTNTAPTTAASIFDVTPTRVVWRKRVRLDQTDGYLTVRFRNAAAGVLLNVQRGGIGLNVYAEVTPATEPVDPVEFYFAVVRTGEPIPARGEYVGTFRAVVDDPDGIRTAARVPVHLYQVAALPEPPLVDLDDLDVPARPTTDAEIDALPRVTLGFVGGGFVAADL